MLTHKQHELLQFICARVGECGVPPSFEEMKDAVGLGSKSGVYRLLEGLQERGFIRRIPARARAIEVIKLSGRPDANSGILAEIAAARQRFGQREFDFSRLVDIAEEHAYHVVDYAALSPEELGIKRARLVEAAALLLVEIERMDRSRAKQGSVA